MKIDSRTRNLLIALAVLAPIASWQYVGPWLARLAGDSAILGGSARGAVDVTTLEVVDLQMAALEGQASSYTPGRNIFGPYVPPPPPPPPYVPPPPPPPYVAPPPPPPVKPVPPPIDFELLGIFGPESRRIAAITDGETEINALLGQEFKEKFIVDRIGFESIDVRFVGFPDVPPRRVEIEE